MIARRCALAICAVVLAGLTVPASAAAYTWRDVVPTYTGGTGATVVTEFSPVPFLWGWTVSSRREAANSVSKGFGGDAFSEGYAVGDGATFTYHPSVPNYGEYAHIVFMEEWVRATISSDPQVVYMGGVGADATELPFASIASPNAVTPLVHSGTYIGGAFGAVERVGKYSNGTNLPKRGFVTGGGVAFFRSGVFVFARRWNGTSWEWRSRSVDVVQSYVGAASLASAVTTGTGLGSCPPGITSSLGLRWNCIGGPGDPASINYSAFSASPEYPFPNGVTWSHAGGYYGGETTDPDEVARVWGGMLSPNLLDELADVSPSYTETWTTETTGSVDPSSTVNPTDDASASWILDLIPEPFQSWLRSWAGSVAQVTNQFRDAWWFLDPWARFDEQRVG